jgi:hypothetical protein
MQDVTVKRTELLEKLLENRRAHREVFEDALEGYRKMMIEHLEGLLEEARQGKRINHMIQLAQPMDQTGEYDQAIKMLEMSVDDEIELTSREFGCYVMDRWDWKRQFSTSNSSYCAFTHEGSLPESYGSALKVDR